MSCYPPTRHAPRRIACQSTKRAVGQRRWCRCGTLAPPPPPPDPFEPALLHTPEEVAPLQSLPPCRQNSCRRCTRAARCPARTKIPRRGFLISYRFTRSRFPSGATWLRLRSAFSRACVRLARERGWRSPRGSLTRSMPRRSGQADHKRLKQSSISLPCGGKRHRARLGGDPLADAAMR